MIEVTSLDRTMVFQHQEALAEYVQGLRDRLGGLYGPMDQACVRKLAELSNGNAPAGLAELARNLTHFAPPKPERPPSPFDDAIENVRAEDEELKGRHRALQEGVWAKVDQFKAEHWRRKKAAAGDPAKLRLIAAWFEAREQELAAERERRDAAEADWQRTHAKVSALLAQRSRWHTNREARFTFEGETVSLAELHERLAMRNE